MFYQDTDASPENANDGALVYMHGGGYTVGTGDEFERGLRIVAEESKTTVSA